jgi:hypothetical protein
VAAPGWPARPGRLRRAGSPDLGAGGSTSRGGKRRKIGITINHRRASWS